LHGAKSEGKPTSARALSSLRRRTARSSRLATITIRHSAATSGKPANGDIKSSRLNLEPIFALVQYLPIDDKLRLRLGRFAPVGVLESGSLTWTGNADKLVDYQLRAQFREVGVSAVDAFPGSRAYRARRCGRKERTLNVVADGTRVTLPQVFATPLDFDNRRAQVSWKITDHVAVKVHRLAFANADAAGTAQGDYRTQDKGPAGRPDRHDQPRQSAVGAQVSAGVGRPDGAQLAARRVARGTASDGKFVLKGNLYDFPFPDNKGGAFLVTAKATGAALDYADRWPVIENIKAGCALRRREMQIDANEATSLGLALNRVHVEIPNMGIDTPHLVIRAKAAATPKAFSTTSTRVPSATGSAISRRARRRPEPAS
jgi:uncharacterized protein YhdP